jgi:ribosomal protein S18 acetylase RimI-like enzyme
MELETFDFERDFDQVIRLWSEAGPGIQLSPSDSAEEIKKKLMRDPDLFLIARQGGQLLGAVLGGFDGRRGMVYHLAVRATDRKRGVGRALMEELESRLRAKGCLKYYLLVTPDNRRAVAFYERLGWEVMPLDVMGKVIE